MIEYNQWIAIFINVYKWLFANKYFELKVERVPCGCQIVANIIFIFTMILTLDIYLWKIIQGKIQIHCTVTISACFIFSALANIIRNIQSLQCKAQSTPSVSTKDCLFSIGDNSFIRIILGLGGCLKSKKARNTESDMKVFIIPDLSSGSSCH